MGRPKIKYTLIPHPKLNTKDYWIFKDHYLEKAIAHGGDLACSVSISPPCSSAATQCNEKPTPQKGIELREMNERIDQNNYYPFLLPHHIPRAWGCRSRCVRDRIRYHLLQLIPKSQIQTHKKLYRFSKTLIRFVVRFFYLSFFCLFVVSVKRKRGEREIKR